MVELQVLGPLEVIGESGPLKVAGPKQRRLLAALTVNANTVVPSERLIDVVWDGTPPGGSHRSFKVYVARLRAALADGGADQPIVTHQSGYALEIDRKRLDANCFEEMVDTARSELALGEVERAISLVDDALALWRGPAYEEFADEEWVQGVAARLEGSRIAAHELRIEAQLAYGRHQELLPEIDELITRFPYRDQLRGQRMLCLYRSGRHVDALREYQEYRQILVDEVGVEPGVELVELEQRMVAHDQDLLATQPATRRLRDYELGERTGADEYAVIYRGWQLSVGRDVTIRAIRPELANRIEFIRRFEAEAQLIAGLEHPHIVPLYDYWREPGGAFLVMRWLGGGSLQQRLQQIGPLEIDEVVRLADHIGSALGAAHRAGIVHGEVTPANVVFDEAGNAYLTGLGGGAPPEGQAAGEDEPSTAKDVQALGRVLYAALTGSPPTRPSDDWSPEPIRPGLPTELDDAVRRACSQNPSTRFVDTAALVVAMRAGGGAVPVPADPIAARDEFLSDELERVNPYKGLRAFAEGDTADFFGRDGLTSQLLEDLRRSNFVAVVGPSGSGKSSLVRAGVVPEMRDDGVFVATMIPGTRPFEDLERALLRISPHADTALLARLSGTSDGIAQAVRSVLPPKGQLLIVIDQFEELFTTTPADRRDAFLDGLAELADGPESPARVVVTVRADFYDRPLSHRRLGPLVRDHTIAVTPLSNQELESAVTGPARRTGVEFEPVLVTELVADAAANPGMLPLLQFALTELYANRTSRRISASDYRAMGGMSGILAARADALFDDLGDANAEAVRRLFTQLVTPGERTDDTRRRVRVSELAGVPEIVLDVYSKARLLTFDRDAMTREPTVEVAHEALIREWPRLHRWIDDDRQDLRILSHLTAAAREWSDGGRDDDELYRGARLAAAVEVEGDHRESLGPLAAEFLTASVNARDEAEAEEQARRERELLLERRSARRLRQIVAILVVATMLGATVSWWALIQRGKAESQADLATTRELMGSSSANLDSDAELGLLLALEAAETAGDPDPELEGELHEALTNGLGALRTQALFDGATVASGRDGEIVVTIGRDGEVVAHDLAAGASTVTLGRAAEPPSDFTPTPEDQTLHPDVVSGSSYGFSAPLAVSEDGTTVMFLEEPDRPVVVDMARPNLRTSLTGLPGPVEHVELSPDGTRAVIGGIDRTVLGSLREAGSRFVWFWDVTAEMPIVARNVVTADAEFSPDGAWIAVALPFVHGTEIAIWDATSGERDATRDLCCHPGADGAVRVAFSGDGTRLASIGLGENRVRVWDPSGGSDPIEGPDGLDPSAIALSPDGTLLAQGNRDGSIHLFDLALERVTVVLRGHRGEVVDVEFVADGTRLISAGGTGDTRIWNVDADPDASGTASWIAHSSPLEVGHRVVFSPDSRTVVTTSGTGESRRWDALTGDPLGPALTSARGSTEFLGASFSPDGSIVAVGGLGNREEAAVRIFDAATGELHQTFDGGFVYAHADVAFSPDGSSIVTVPSGTRSAASSPRIFDVESGFVTRRLGPDLRIRETQVAWSPQGDLIATGGPGTPVRIHNDTSQLLISLDIEVNDLAFSPDGSLLATAGEQIHVWDVDTWEQSEPFSGHEGPVNSISFSPDGRELLGGGDDGQPRVWDVATGRVRFALPAHATAVTGVDYSLDGTKLATIDRDGRVVIRPATLDQLIAVVEERVTRSLTDVECLRYLHVSECPGER